MMATHCRLELLTDMAVKKRKEEAKKLIKEIKNFVIKTKPPPMVKIISSHKQKCNERRVTIFCGVNSLPGEK